MRGIIWFREDLRLQDNTALYHAAKKCEEGLIAVYCIDINFWKQHHVAACRIDFILRGLAALSEALGKLNIPLLIRTVKETSAIAHTLYQIADEVSAQAVFFNRQHEVNELRRDQVVQRHLSAKQIECYTFDDQTILPPGQVKTQQGHFFSVFTPYKRAWQRKLLEQKGIKLQPAPKKQAALSMQADPVPTSIANIKTSVDPSLWPAGEKIAYQRLDQFLEKKLFLYDKQRDFPAIDGTSQLSPYLAAGMISARACFSAAMMANHNEIDTGNPGAVTWLSELVWRDFYKEIMIAAPRVSMNRAFKPETEALKWRDNAAQLAAWKQGQTGFPIIDAAMRQLNQIGWMHNRLRMVVAMFFSKNLFFDWRVGEEYFMEHLIDGDLSANNGGWQWSASTGTDAAPYFRIFNPIRQSERFDPQGDFIRHYCPELRNLNSKLIHNPPLLTNYPAQIVNLDVSRRQAIAAFKSI
jgi:deoxyribodipyrimidine photo-lyase